MVIYSKNQRKQKLWRYSFFSKFEDMKVQYINSYECTNDVTINKEHRRLATSFLRRLSRSTPSSSTAFT